MENLVTKPYLRRADFEQRGLSEGCPRVPVPQNWTRSESKLTAKHVGGGLKACCMLQGDWAGSAPLAAADERINRALADAVERHATKDPGVRGKLKRASATCSS